MLRSLLLALGLLLLPLPAIPRGEAAPDRGWDYVVRFDEGLTKAEVRCCFRGWVPKRIVHGFPGLQASVTLPAGEGEARLVPRASDGSLIPRGLRRGRMCVRWTVDLTKAAGVRGGRQRPVQRVGRDVLIAPGALLFRPYLWPLDGRVTVRLELPAGMRAIVPWPAAPGESTYSLDPQCTNLLGRFAVGRFVIHRKTVAGAAVEVAILDAPLRASQPAVCTWVHAAVEAVAGLFGRFPAAKLAAIVHPSPGRDPPVIFGLAMRAGGAHAHLFVANAAADEELPGEWVGVHEMMHLGMPWTHDDEAWLQEGFVTYYQEVLRARAGMIEERQAWQNIEDGFGRGRRRGGRRSLELESRDMGREHNYHRVYWAGAAMALRIDFALRKASRGRQSLDDVIRWWHRERGGVVRPYHALELLRAADRALGTPVASKIAAGILADRAFPDVRAAYAALGLRVQAGRIELDDEAPLAAQRKAIMAPRLETRAGTPR